MAHLAESSVNPVRSTLLSGVLVTLKADIGATGAPTVDDSATTPGVTITRTDTGDYSITFPTCPDAAAPNVRVVGSTIATVQLLTFVPTSGTATITCYSDAITTPADPASGDDLYFSFVGATCG